MEPKIVKRAKWKIPDVEDYNYQFYFCQYFNKYNPEFVREMKNDLIQLYLKIFGKHEETTLTLSEYNWMLAVPISQNDYRRFAFSVLTKLEVFGYETEGYKERFLPTEKLTSQTDKLLNKIVNIIKKYNLFFENKDKEIQLWLIHAILCQIEAGEPDLITPRRQLVFELPFEMLENLWLELPELEQKLVMENQERDFKEKGIYDRYVHIFESLEVFMKSFLFKKHLPPPALFDFRHYNIYEDVKNYEKMTVKAFRNHIKSYTKRMIKALDESGLKRNNIEDYSQTEWLVIWNKYKVNYLWEIFPYIPDFQKVNPNNDKAKRAAEDRLRKAFIKFEKHGLPVRPFGKNRKNSSKKTNTNLSTSKI